MQKQFKHLRKVLVSRPLSAEAKSFVIKSDSEIKLEKISQRKKGH